MQVTNEGKRLIFREGNSQLWIEPWGENSLRVRMTAFPQMDGHDWALMEPVGETDAEITYETVDTTDPWYRGEEYAKYHQQGTYARLRNGKITAELNPEGWLRFLNQKGEELTAEFWRNRNRLNRYALPLNLKGRELKPIMSTNEVELTARF